jgi:ADP-dependent NAD(P)H-hydrate dehydratase / NAD(P)H-hydrate epimerase
MRLPREILKRNPNTHKGDYGHVLILGGSPGLTGAVCLSAKAALRTGCGLVTVGIPKSLNSIFEVKLTEIMSLPLADQRGFLDRDAFKEIEEILNKIDVIVLGPGASLKGSTQALLRKITKSIDKPLVIDADAITAISADSDILLKRKAKDVVLTPHEGEFKRLIKVKSAEAEKTRKELVKGYALRYNLTLVFKGHGTLVSDGKKLFENTTGNPGMATAGSGDVLTGIIAGLIAQGLSAFEASKFGVYLHGLAADLAVKDKTQNALIATDIIEYLPKAYKSASK